MYRFSLAIGLLWCALSLAHPNHPLPLVFEPNQGQADPWAKFVARGEGYVLLLAPDQALLRGDTSVCIHLIGANQQSRPEGVDLLAGKSHYFTGSDPKQWRRGIPQYARVRLRDVYPGIDLVYYGNQRRVEFDFLISPGSDPARIELRFEGAQPELAEDGSLRAGSFILHPPGVSQDGAAIAGRYSVHGGGRVSFELGDYDRSRPLTIDPTLSYSTYLGGDGAATGGRDFGRAIAVDPSGNIYVAGSTESTKFPVTDGAFQKARGGGDFDAFVVKFDPNGTIIYSALLGGEATDEAFGIAVDADGNAYVTGATNSSKFPVTSGALQTKQNGSRDAFVSKLDPAGANLVYSTYLGGQGDDTGTAIAVDATGAAYVAGTTMSSGFPVTSKAYQQTLRFQDAFVARIDAAGASLIFSTLLGGNSTDSASALALDSSGNVYVAGQTSSANFPVSADATKSKLSGTNVPVDAFLTKFNEDGSKLLYSTFLGGDGTDSASTVAVDAGGNAIVAGWTDSRNFPVSKDAVQPSYGGGAADGFVCEFSAKGNALVYGSYFGGSQKDVVNAIALAPSGGLWLAGQTGSTDLPVTDGAPQSGFAGGAADGFLARMPASLASREYVTYGGGGGEDGIAAMAVDSGGSVYLTGSTASKDFPTTTGATVSAGGSDALLIKLDPSGAPLFSTVFGGSGISTGEDAQDIAVDAAGNAYITGRTTSLDFPVTGGTVQTAYSGGSGSDAYVTKLDPTGSQVLFSTYLGGSSDDAGSSIALDASGNIYVAGTTASKDFPVTDGAPQKTYAGNSDALVVKLSPDGASLVFSTLLGGTLIDRASRVAVGPDGNAWVAGATMSADFPTKGAAQAKHGGGLWDAFASKLDPAGSSLVFSTYLGGAADDNGNAIALDSAGNAWIAGTTRSPDFRVTSGAYQKTPGGGSDAFLTELDTSGALLYSTFFGGSGDDDARWVAVDTTGRVYLAGGTSSSNFPITKDAY